MTGTSKRLALRLANGLMRLGSARAVRQFTADIEDPGAAQASTLQRILTANRQCDYGLRHGFARIALPADYQKQVPIVTYDDLRPQIERIKAGENGVLTSEAVLAFEKSSGSTAAAKYLPFTESLKREFWAGTALWLADLQAKRPGLRGVGAYWSVSPLAREKEFTAGGIPVGFEEDTEYFGSIDRWITQQLLLTPPGISRITDLATARYVTLRGLVDAACLGIISVWNPSFLTLMFECAESEADRLLHDLRHGTLSPPQPLARDHYQILTHRLRPNRARAEAIAQRLATNGTLVARDLWPELQLVSCWGDAAAAHSLPPLLRRLDGVELQPKGLLATEGILTFPLLDEPGGVPALRSHFFEYLPVDDPESPPVLLQALDPGQRYEVLVTTGGGLYRYRMHDVVEVVGAIARTPLLRFVGKTDLISDQVGEKLNEQHVARLITTILITRFGSVPFALLAPELTPVCHYVLHLEMPDIHPATQHALVVEVEAGLAENPHYAYARLLGQLAPCRLSLTPPGAARRFLAGCVSLGQRAGNVKSTYLHRTPGWLARLGEDCDSPDSLV